MKYVEEKNYMGIGNLLGFGSGGAKPINNVSGGLKPGQVVRNIDFSKQRRFSRQGVKSALSSGVLNAKVLVTAKKNIVDDDGSNIRKGDKTITHQKLKEDNVIELMRKKYVGKTSGQIERMIKEERGIKIEDANQRIQYELAAKDRNIIKNIVTGGDGPTREEIAADEKKQERFRRFNVLNIQRSREKAYMAAQLQSKRAGGMKKSIDMRNADNTKINASNIGAAVIHSTVSAQAGKSSMGVKEPVQPGFAGTASKANDEKPGGNVVSLDAHREAKGISSEPVFRTGTDG